MSSALLAMGVTAPSRAQSDASATFTGTWRLGTSMTEAEREVDQAVDRAVSAMQFFERPIARDRLRSGTTVNRTIVLAFHGERATVRFATGDSYTTQLGHTERRVEDGEAMRVTQRVRSDGSLEQVFQTDSGTRWYVYRPQDDGTLRVEVITNSDRMPQAMRFTLPYRRE
ncbi:MAG: hypothetical protein AB7S26_32740 [Sandaracinaceae bacterium]